MSRRTIITIQQSGMRGVAGGFLLLAVAFLVAAWSTATSMPRPAPAMRPASTTAANPFQQDVSALAGATGVFQPDTVSAVAADQARSDLEDLHQVAPASLDGFSPDLLDPDAAGDPCKDLVRQAILRDSGRDVVRTNGCVLAGRWHSSYDDADVLDSSLLTVDYVVGLSDAWRSGAASWYPGQRHTLTTLPDERIAVTTTSARDRAGRPPSQWRPSNKADWCPFAVRYISIKAANGFSVTSADHTALADMLTTCPTG